MTDPNCLHAGPSRRRTIINSSNSSKYSTATFDRCDTFDLLCLFFVFNLEPFMGKLIFHKFFFSLLYYNSSFDYIPWVLFNMLFYTIIQGVTEIQVQN